MLKKKKKAFFFLLEEDKTPQLSLKPVDGIIFIFAVVNDHNNHFNKSFKHNIHFPLLP